MFSNLAVLRVNVDKSTVYQHIYIPRSFKLELSIQVTFNIEKTQGDIFEFIVR